MMELKSTKVVRGLTIDNGGSELRVLPEGNTDVVKIPNDFVEIEEAAFRVKEVDPRSVIRFIEAPNPEFLGLMATGMAGKAYNGTAITISNQEQKTASLAYYRQFLFGIAYDAYDAIESHRNEYSTKLVSVECKYRRTMAFDVNFLYSLVTCIPVREHSGVADCAKRLKEAIKGKYIVEFPLFESMPAIQFEISEKFFGVVPEGAVSMVALGNKISPDDYSLVIDIGRITADIALFKGKDMLGKVASSSFAGSTLAGNVRAALSENGFYVSEEQAERCVETGLVKSGADEVNIADIVAEQKEMYVRNYLRDEIVQVLNANALKAAQVQNVIPIGAPMNTTQTGDLCGMIAEDCWLSRAKIHRLADNLRYVNIMSASLFTKAISSKAREYYKK